MIYKITDELRAILNEVLAARCPGLEVFSASNSFRDLSQAEHERVVDALALELTEKELMPNGEPTPRGLKVDGLIGYFVPYDLPMHPTKGAGEFEPE